MENVNNDLKNSYTEYYTQTRNENRRKKVVLNNMKAEQLKNILEQTGQKIKEVIPLRSRKSETKKSYLIITPKDNDMEQIRQLENIDNIRVGWECYNKMHNASDVSTHKQILIKNQCARNDLDSILTPNARSRRQKIARHCVIIGDHETRQPQEKQHATPGRS